jgi:hypothetical protein
VADLWLDGELLAEYAVNGAATAPQREYGYRNGQLLVTAEPASSSNVALASSGGTATGSATLSPYAAGNVIDGSRRAINAGLAQAKANLEKDRGDLRTKL